MKRILWYLQVVLLELALVGYVVWLCVLQAVPVLPDPDAFYHIGMAQHLWQFGLADHFTGLQPTTLGQHFVDQHFLLHLLMRPLVLGIGAVVGTKVFAVLAVVVILAVFAVVLRQLGTKAWWIGVVLLAVCNPWLFRLQLIKATPLALILLILAVLALYRRWYIGLVLVSGVYVWSHGGFILLPLLVGIWCVSQTVVQWRLHWKDYIPVVYALLGVVVALLVQPAFPNNLLYYWEQLVQIGAVNYQHVIGVGGEWYPYDPAVLWFGHVPLLAALLIGIVIHVATRQRFTVAQLAFTGYTILFTLLTFKSKRYVEYVSPMLAATAALYLHSVWSVAYAKWRLTAFLPLAAVVVVLTPVTLSDLAAVRSDLANGQNVSYLAGAGAYLATLPPGQTVAPSDWDDFPALWRAAPQQAYLIGLDPTFLYLANSERYDAWKRLTLGETVTAEDLVLIAVQYYVVASDHGRMYQHLMDLGAEVVYEDSEAWVLQYPGKK